MESHTPASLAERWGDWRRAARLESSAPLRHVPPRRLAAVTAAAALATLAATWRLSRSHARLRFLRADAGAGSLDCATALAAGATPLTQDGPRTGSTFSFTSSHVIWESLRPCTAALQRSVYVYTPADLGGLDLFPLSAGLTKWMHELSQYGAEWFLPHLLSQSDLVTDDPSAAALFVVPFYGTFEAHYCLFVLKDPAIGSDLATCAEWVERHYAVPWRDALRRSPWFQRHNGADHLFVAPWDWGIHLFARNAGEFYAWLRNETSLQVVQNLPLPELRNDERTVVIPVPQAGSLAPATVLQAAMVPPPSGARGAKDGLPRRAPPGTSGCDLSSAKWLATFRGTVWEDRDYSGGIRQDLLALYGGPANSAAAAADGVLFEAGHTTAEQYVSELRDTRFCLSPPGSSPWSQRIYDLVAAGCVIVFFDSAKKGPPSLAFRDVIAWDDFSVTIPVGQHSQVARLLRAIPDARVCAMRRTAVTAASFLLWNRDPQAIATLVAASALARAQRLIAANATR